MKELYAPIERFFASSIHATGSLIVMRDPMSLYHAWRELDNLDRFIEGLISVEQISSTRSRWTVKGPANTRHRWEADVITDQPGKRISWKTVGEPDVASAGTIMFRELTGDRGTLVRVSLEYDPPGGTAGDAVARWFGEDPKAYIKGALYRFRQVMETGEVAISKSSTSDKLTKADDQAEAPAARGGTDDVRDIAIGKELA